MICWHFARSSRAFRDRSEILPADRHDLLIFRSQIGPWVKALKLPCTVGATHYLPCVGSLSEDDLFW